MIRGLALAAALALLPVAAFAAPPFSQTGGATAVITDGSVTASKLADGAVDATSAKFTGPVPVNKGGTAITSGTSGGVLAFTASGTIASSGALGANLPVIGGGAGVAPSVGTRSGNTTAFVTTTGTQTSGDCVKIDASGNHIANGSACASAPSVGTWSPTFTGSSTGGTQTYSVQFGNYVKTGTNVVATFELRLSAISATGNLLLTNLPFTSLNANSGSSTPGSCMVSFFQGFTLSAGTAQIGLMVRPNATTADIYSSGSATGFVSQAISGVASNAYLTGTCVYQSAS